MIEPTTYFLYLSLSKLHILFVFITKLIIIVLLENQLNYSYQESGENKSKFHVEIQKDTYWL